MVEYRICWFASSNISFRGETDWTPWDDDLATAREITVELFATVDLARGLEEALNASGFEWRVETREASR